MAGLCACYFGPIQGVDTNEAPLIVNATAMCQECEPVTIGNTTFYCEACEPVLVLEDDFTKVWVATQDEDELAYIWDVTGPVGRIFSDETLEDGSQVNLPYDTDLDMEVLTCAVTDGSRTARISWLLELP